MKVVVFQCPWGTAARQRSPRRDRPLSLAILVEAPVSSMKISFSGSRSSWLSNQDCRASRMSGRWCFAACAVFFKCRAVSVEEGPDRRDPDRDVPVPGQVLGDLGQGDVLRAALDEPKDEGRMRIEPGAARLALRPGHGLAALPVAPHPDNGRRDADAEPLGRLTRRHPARRGLDHPRVQIGTVGLDHPRLRITGDHGISLQPVRKPQPESMPGETALEPVPFKLGRIHRSRQPRCSCGTHRV